MKGMVIYGDKVKGLIHVTMLLGALVSWNILYVYIRYV